MLKAVERGFMDKLRYYATWQPQGAVYTMHGYVLSVRPYTRKRDNAECVIYNCFVWSGTNDYGYTGTRIVSLVYPKSEAPVVSDVKNVFIQGAFFRKDGQDEFHPSALAFANE